MKSKRQPKQNEEESKAKWRQREKEQGDQVRETRSELCVSWKEEKSWPEKLKSVEGKESKSKEC